MSWAADIESAMTDGLSSMPQSDTLFKSMYGMYLVCTQNWSDEEFRVEVLRSIREDSSDYHKNLFDEKLIKYYETGYLPD